MKICKYMTADRSVGFAAGKNSVKEKCYRPVSQPLLALRHETFDVSVTHVIISHPAAAVKIG